MTTTKQSTTNMCAWFMGHIAYELDSRRNEHYNDVIMGAVVSQIKAQQFVSRKRYWKCRLQNGGYFVSAEMLSCERSKTFSIFGWTRSQPIREDVTYITSSVIGWHLAQPSIENGPGVWCWYQYTSHVPNHTNLSHERFTVGDDSLHRESSWWPFLDWRAKDIGDSRHSFTHCSLVIKMRVIERGKNGFT